MTTSLIGDPGCEDNRDSRRVLQRTLPVLLVILLALCVVGRKMQFWPIITWPVYSMRTTAFPERQAAYVELHVVTRGGERISVTPPEVFPMGRKHTLESAIEYSFNNDDAASRIANRKWLASVVRDFLPQNDLETLEAWNVVWDVEPLAVPPLKRDQPAKRVFLGSFLLDTPEDPGRAGQ